MTSAGRLDRRVTLLRAVTTTDEFNSPVSTWTELATVAASKEDVSDAERVRAQQVGASLTTRFQIRYSSRVADIDAGDRLTCEGWTFDIKSVKELDRRVGLEISAARVAQRVAP
jgi:SPP1 family predicted phage head-tail adaptor